MAARSCPYGQDDPPEMAKVGLPRKAGVLRHNLRHTAGRNQHSPNAKGNFCFDRVIALDRSRCVLDLRLKKVIYI